MSCYTWQGRAPKPWDEAGLSIPRRPSSQTQQRSSARPGSPSDRGREEQGLPHPRSSRHTAASPPRCSSDPGARPGQAGGALAAPTHTEAAWCQGCLPPGRDALWPALSNRGLEPSVNAQEPRRARRDYRQSTLRGNPRKGPQTPVLITRGDLKSILSVYLEIFV